MAKKPKPVREMDAILIRVPDGMKQSLTQLAQTHGRSVNGEVVALLSAALDPTAAELSALQAELTEVRRQRHEVAGALEGIDRRMYALVDRIQDLQKALGINPIHEDDLKDG